MQETVGRAERGAGGVVPRLLCVVPTLDEAEGIAACLLSLRDGETLIEVVDGGSTDGTPGIAGAFAADDPTIRVVANPRRRQAAAVNDAARRFAASGAGEDAVLVRCDAHATYPDGFLRGVARRLAETGADGLAVPMDAEARAGAGLFARANALAVDTPLGSGGSAHRGGTRSGWVDHGHHAGLRLGPFLRLGGYDEGLMANEDAEYDTRLARSGGRVWLESSLRIRYFVRETPGGLWRQYHAYGRGRAAHVRRHKVRPRARQLAPALHAGLLAASAAAAPVFPAALFYPAAYAGLLLAASVRLCAARRDPAGLLAFAPLAVMHLAWGTGFWRGMAAR